MKAKVPRVVVLAVAEVTDAIESLEAAQTVKSLSGRQRRQLQDARDKLVQAVNNARKGEVRLPTSLVLEVLRCATMTQRWLSEALAELSFVNMDE
jgi:hypothetical protein